MIINKWSDVWYSSTSFRSDIIYGNSLAMWGSPLAGRMSVQTLTGQWRLLLWQIQPCSSETLASKKSALRERIDSLHRSVQYEPWFIKVSTLDRRLLLAIALLPVLLFGVVLVLIVVGATQGYDCQNMMNKGADYRGNTDRTRSGLECIAWHTLDRKTHTVTIDRWGHQASFSFRFHPFSLHHVFSFPFPSN